MLESKALLNKKDGEKMSELANETMRYASGTIRGLRDGVSFLQALLRLLKKGLLQFENVGEVSPERFFDKNKNIRLDEFVKNNSDQKEFNIFKDCLKSAKVQYTVQSLGNDNYKIYFKADDVSRVNYAMGEFTKRMDELNKSKTQDKTNEQSQTESSQDKQPSAEKTEVEEQSKEYQEQSETPQQGDTDIEDIDKEQKSTYKESNLSDKSVTEILTDGIADLKNSMLNTAEQGIQKTKDNKTKDALLGKAESKIQAFRKALFEKFKDDTPITEEDMDINSVFERAEFEAQAHNAELDNRDIAQSKQRDVSL